MNDALHTQNSQVSDGTFLLFSAVCSSHQSMVALSRWVPSIIFDSVGNGQRKLPLLVSVEMAVLDDWFSSGHEWLRSAEVGCPFFVFRRGHILALSTSTRDKDWDKFALNTASLHAKGWNSVCYAISSSREVCVRRGETVALYFFSYKSVKRK